LDGRAFYRDKLGLGRYEMPGFEARGDAIVAPDNYPSKGTGELGAFFYDSEDNLIAIAQPIRESAQAA
jgi:hypothetical protein